MRSGHDRTPFSSVCLALTMFRRGRGPLDEVRPTELPARWQGPVVAALDCRMKFHEFISRIDPGPLRSRVDEATRGVDEGVLTVWALAQKGVLASHALANSDPRRATDELKAAQRRLVRTESDAERDDVEAEVAVLSARHSSLQRLWNTVDEVDDQLARAVDRLGTAVAQIMELAVTVNADRAGQSIRTMDQTVLELRSLHDALQEVLDPYQET